MQRLLALTAGLGLITLGAATMWLAAGGRHGPAPTEESSPDPNPIAVQATPPSEPLDPADDYRRILGTWQDNYQGRRTMTLCDDGTATMVCELEGLNARLFTPVLHLNLRWQLDDGIMTRVIIDGEPPDKVRFVMNLMGARADEKLLALTDTELHLLDADGKTEYRWTRVQ